MGELSPAQFAHAFQAEVCALLEAGATAAGGQFTVPLDNFTDRLHRIVQKELLDREECTPDDHATIAEFLARLRADDLYLAVACDAGDERAWEVFYEKYRDFIERTAAQFCQNSGAADELANTVLGELFLPTQSDESVSRIGRYSGLGSLHGWLRASIHHRAIDRFRRAGPSASIDDEETSPQWEKAASVTTDPIESLIEQKYLEVANRALVGALSELERRERLLLVFYYRDGLTLKEIGALPSFGVHEATVSRWLEKIHKKLRQGFERRLLRDERLKQAEIRECRELAMRQGVLEIEQYLQRSG